MIDAMKDDPKDRAANSEKPPDGPPGGGGGEGGDGVPGLAQLKLLRALQAEVNERTEAFDKAHPDPTKLTPEQKAELDAIRRQQAELSALFEDVAPADDDKPGEKP